MKKIIWIIGANSDVAREFMKNEADASCEYVLASRNVSNLQEFIQKQQIINATAAYIDLEREESISAFIRGRETPYGILITAGCLESSGCIDRIEEMKRVFSANLLGVIILLEHILPKMYQNGQGFVIGLSSIAGERGKSSNVLYSSAKAGLTSYLEGIMQKNEKHNIRTIIVKPGFIHSKMLRQSGKQPNRLLVCEPQTVAHKIAKAIRKNQSAEFYVSGIWRLLMFLYRLIPIKMYKLF